MVTGGAARDTFSEVEAEEIRSLLDELPQARLAVQRMTMARLRRVGLNIAADSRSRPTRAQFEELVSSGALRIEHDGRTLILPHQSGNVFRVAVGVTGHPVLPTWNAFEQRYQWFGKHPKSVTSGAHLFVLAVDRWKSAVVGLYEAVSAGADKLPGSSDPDRWPWAFGVRPLAAIPPPDAERVPGQQGPANGLPASVPDPEVQEQLYRAVAASPPPPGPRNLEHHVQELESQDVLDDVLEAVRSLGQGAREPAIISRAIELGDWSGEELKARAWYTGSGVDSHIEHIVSRALRFEVGSKGSLQQHHGVYSLNANVFSAGFGVPYRPAARDHSEETGEPFVHLADLAELDRATQRHMDLQDRLAEALQQQEIKPLSPNAWQPRFDLAFKYADKRFVVEVKSGEPVTTQQVRLGAGQLLEYCHLLQRLESSDAQAVLLVESSPPDPWSTLLNAVGIHLLRADQLDESLSALLSSA